jgi:hypothetical protein
VAPVEVEDAFFVEGSDGGGAGINGNAAQSRQISGRNGEAWIFGIACANARSGFENIGGRGQHTFLDRPDMADLHGSSAGDQPGKVRIVPAGFTAHI